MNGNPLNDDTVSGCNGWEVLSAMQKAVRRNQPCRAALWAMELAMSGLYGIAASRLRVIAQEDIGPADPQAVTYAILTLDQTDAWYKARNSSWRLGLVNVCYALARADKSRIGDLLQACVLDTILVRKNLPEIPDEALDKHTSRGKMMGRGLDHFLDEGSALVGERPLQEDEEAYKMKAENYWREKGDALAEAQEEAVRPKRKSTDK